MVVIYLLLLYVVNTKCITAGEYCSKEGITGVCTNIKVCPDAQQDIANRKHPVLCDFTQEDPVVCCISTNTITTTTESIQQKNCVLPPYPKHGTYVSNVPDGKPGGEYDLLYINITCQEGYQVDGLDGPIFCRKGYGWWPGKIPLCKPYACHLTPNPSVEYDCLITEGGVLTTRPCKEYEPLGTVVSPRCRGLDYYSPTSLQFMHCIDGIWDYVAICMPVPATCHLKKSSRVKFKCIVSESGGNRTRPCKESEPHGTVVIPSCRTEYRSESALELMHCIEGSWDYIAECIPDDSQFSCPTLSKATKPGSFHRHSNPKDCRQYYICKEEHFREYSCPFGTVFKLGDLEGTGSCEDPADVPGCEHYYRDPNLKELREIQ